MRKLFQLVLAAVLGSAVTLIAYQKMGFIPASNPGNSESITNSENLTTPHSTLTNYGMPSSLPLSAPTDFTAAAAKSTPAVVHIQSTIQYQATSNQYTNPFDFFGDDFFFGPRGRGGQPRPQIATGSGVILSSDGYIVTNNHVVAKATELEVTLYDKRTYKATLVGTDPSTDLAVIKIDDTNLPTLALANSDEAQVGEWVLAVGNPFNLESTVTAGIVSAKGRNIKILEDKMAIESFIQTDAAVNQGNSGGALVNTSGQLLGINTAIATPTGTYAGYSFAVPANIVGKVVDDLKKYGVVQRAFLGISISNVDGKLAKENGLNVTQGVYVGELLESGPAVEAGITKGDVIVRIGNAEIKSISELQEQIALHRPGDRLMVTVNRKGAEKTLPVVLKNKEGNTGLVTKNTEKLDLLTSLGAEFENLTNRESADLGIQGGVRVKKLKNGQLSNNTNIREGFIITKVDDTLVSSTDQLSEVLYEKKGNGALLKGIYPNAPKSTYFYGIGI
ncbi:MAG: Do family serine endopeptidase [Sphingobacteriales bacterium]|nr:MAG: Do family serine endopeptidase [Sphingobacteriales bacterium]